MMEGTEIEEKINLFVFRTKIRHPTAMIVAEYWCSRTNMPFYLEARRAGIVAGVH